MFRFIAISAACLMFGAATSRASLVIFEAESGTPGSAWVVSNGASPEFISIGTASSGYNPGSAARVAAYNLNFPGAGLYYLYARVRVGPDAFNDDSLFVGNGFGAKSPTSNSDWVMVNGLGSAGFSNSADEVTGGGTLGGVMWKWVNLSLFTGQAGFTVNEGNLSTTFQIGGREDGLSIDKFAFGAAGITFTVADLDSGTVPGGNLNTNVFLGPDGVALKRFSATIAGLNTDGANPAGGLIYSEGVLMGTTLNGGVRGGGTAFLVSRDGMEFSTYRTFTNSPDAGGPWAGQVAVGNQFFGTSLAGGANNTGTVYSSGTNGIGKVLQSFGPVHPDFGTNVGGASPGGSLVPGPGGILYGVTAAGGTTGNGTVYSVSTNGSGFSVLHNFSGLNPQTGANADGAQPLGVLALVNGRLYGTAPAGGHGGSGLIFMLATNGSGFAPLHEFPPIDVQTGTNTEGAMPMSGVVVFEGTMYGTTTAGGRGGQGTIYSIRMDNTGFRVLHHFPPLSGSSLTNAQGGGPVAELLISGKRIFGTAARGGAGGAGVVFSYRPSSGEFNVLHHFTGPGAGGTNADGAFPVSPVLRVQNRLYGTAFGGGPGGSGTVFALEVPPEPAFITDAVLNSSEASITLRFAGEPAATNIVESTTTLLQPLIWEEKARRVADANGLWEFTDSVNSPARFYRARTL